MMKASFLRRNQALGPLITSVIVVALLLVLHYCFVYKPALTISSAIKSGDYEAVSNLVWDKHVDLNAVESNGLMPLEEAIQTGDPQMVKLLLQLGADPTLVMQDEIALPDIMNKGDRQVIIDLLKGEE